MTRPLLTIGLTLLLVGCATQTPTTPEPQQEPDPVCIRWEERMKWFVCPRDSEPIELFDGGYNGHEDCFVSLEENARIVGDCVEDMKDGQSLCYNPRIDKVLRRDCEEWSSSPRP